MLGLSCNLNFKDKNRHQQDHLQEDSYSQCVSFSYQCVGEFQVSQFGTRYTMVEVILFSSALRQSVNANLLDPEVSGGSDLSPFVESLKSNKIPTKLLNQCHYPVNRSTVKKMQFFGGSEISPSPPPPTVSGNNAHMLYVFNRNGVCLLYREWNRPLKTLNPQQDHKLMFGLLFSLKSLTAKMDPTSAEKGNLGVPQLPGQGCSFHSFRTNTYKLSFMESPSGIKIILVTHPRTGDLRESLKYIYNLYVEYVVKNLLYSPGAPIKCELFNSTLDQYVRGLG
ncbi:uncharacterized protein LOC129896828 [Solanum dulcamara]|uniref:uncharacterized protein LOC129896828 n=1 Tax=Solanum dulcamara TaxID=45834 RepID=UPI002484E427|nr:uncharacterized protein LOC129896828 [Solanum dulcamara]